MIYFEEKSTDLYEIYFHLEELVCLSSITNQKCKLKISNDLKKYFNLSFFYIVENLPELSTINLSDYVCMYDDDLNTQYGFEFIKNRASKTKTLSRLDKFKQDLCVELDLPNYFEAKYFTSDLELLKKSYQEAMNFDFINIYINHVNKAKELIKPLPLICIKSEHTLTQKYNFPFQDCFIWSDFNISHFAKLNNLNAYLFENFLQSYMPNIDLKLLSYFLADYFQDIYGEPRDNFYALLCKAKFKNNPNWQVNILHDSSFATIKDFHFKIVNKNANFYFTQCDFNLQRYEILSLMRNQNCVSLNI